MTAAAHAADHAGTAFFNALHQANDNLETVARLTRERDEAIDRAEAAESYVAQLEAEANR